MTRLRINHQILFANTVQAKGIFRSCRDWFTCSVFAPQAKVVGSNPAAITVTKAKVRPLKALTKGGSLTIATCD